MAEKVQVRGGTLDGSILDNAATEATLSRLAAAMEKRSGGSGSKVVEMQERTIKNNISAVSKSSDNLSVFTNTLSNVNTSSKKLGETFARMSSLALGGVLSGIATAGKSLLGFFTNSLDSFRETSQVGATFNNDLVELRRTAASAAMPLDMFTDLIKNNSRVLAAFGGTVTGGAQRFADLSKQLRTGDLGARFMGMGMTMGDLNEFMAEYLDLEMKSGRLANKSDADLLQGTQSYIMEMDKLTKITGLSRRQQSDALRTAMRDGRIINLQNSLSGEALERFRSAVTLFQSNMDPQFMNTIVNAMSGVIDPSDRFGKFLSTAVPNFLSFNRALGEGTLSTEDIVREAQQQIDDIEKYLSRYSRQQIARTPELRAMREYQQSVQGIARANTATAQAEQRRRNTITEAMGSFGQTIQKIKDDILLALIDSGVFTAIQNALTRLSRIFLNNSNRLAPAITRMVEGIDGFLTRFLDTVDTRGIGAALFDVFRDLLRGIFGRRETPEQQQARTQRTRRVGEISQERGALEQQLNITEDPGTAAELQQRIRALDAERQTLMQQSTQSAQGESSFSGLFDLNWEDLRKSIGLVTAAVIAVGGALTLVSKPAALVFGALGFAAGGLGYLFKNLTPFVQTVSDSFGRLPDQLKQFENVDADKLKNLGPALGSLTGPLMAAGFAGVLSAITGNSGLPALANAIRTFEEIDGNKLAIIGGNEGPLRKLYEGLEPFTVQSFGDFIKGIGGALVGSGGLGALANAFATFSIIPTSIGDLKEPLLRLHEGLQPFTLQTFGDFVKGIAGTLVGDQGLGGLARALTNFITVPTSIGDLREPLLKLHEGIQPYLTTSIGEAFARLISGDGGIGSLGRAIRQLQDVDVGKIAALGGTDGPLARLYQGIQPFMAASVGEAFARLLSSDGGIGNLATAIKKFDTVDGGKIAALGGTDGPLAKLYQGIQPFMAASVGEAFARLLSSDGGIGTLADSIKKFEGVDSASLSAVGPALRTLHEGLSQFTGGSQGGLLAAFSGAIGNFLRGDQGLGRFAESFKKFNDINADNIVNLASGISGLKNTVGEDFARQATNIDTFTGSIRVLTTALTELRQAFLNLDERRGGTTALAVAGRLSAVGATAGGAGTGATSEMLAEQRKLNTLIEELRPVFEATRDNTKNVADAVGGRNNPF